MDVDFTYDIYRNLIDAAIKSGYSLLPVRDYLTTDNLPDRFVVMRHDVDRKPQRALDMALIEAERNVRTTYYFRTIDKTFKPDILHRVERLGHEVGYHYEDYVRENGDMERAHESFSSNLSKFREIVTIDTVCMHGNMLTSFDNRDMWEEERNFKEYGLLGEAYLSIDFSEIVYFSDTNRTWSDEKTIVLDQPTGDGRQASAVESTQELAELLETQAVERVYLLVHPNRWTDTRIEFAIEKFKDMTINTAKIGLSRIPRS